MIAGEIAVDLVPQGTLAERIRAAGYGLGGVLTPTGVGTLVAEGAQSIEVDGRTFLLALPIARRFRADRRAPCRLPRQSELRADGAQLQSNHGDGGRRRSSRRPPKSCRSA